VSCLAAIAFLFAISFSIHARTVRPTR
jgi:hypothetical protein